MKKVVTVLMIILFASFAFAQEEVVVEQVETQIEQIEEQTAQVETPEVAINSTNPFTYGVKGGVSFSLLDGDISVGAITLDPNFYTGFSGGIFANYAINDKFSIQPEILFSRKGSRFDEFKFDFLNDVLENVNIGDLLGTKLEFYIRTDWIEIPVLGKYKIDDKLSLYAGPYLGFYLDGKLFVEATAAIFRLIDTDYDIDKDNLRLPDYGIIAGGTYDLSNNIAFDARFSYGFQDIADKVIVDFIADDVLVAKNLAILLQLQFTL